MQKDGSEGNGTSGGEAIDCSNAQKQESSNRLPPPQPPGTSSHLQEDSADKDASAVISIVISRGDAGNQVSAVSELKGNVIKTPCSEKDEKVDAALKKGCLSRSESYHDECRYAFKSVEFIYALLYF